MTLRNELVQIAAVAVAWIEVIDYGVAGDPDTYPGVARVESILGDIEDERIRQNAKWGPQSHASPIWSMILVEEVGEAVLEVVRGAQMDGSYHGLAPLILRSLGSTIFASSDARKFLESEFAS